MKGEFSGCDRIGKPVRPTVNISSNGLEFSAAEASQTRPGFSLYWTPHEEQQTDPVSGEAGPF